MKKHVWIYNSAQYYFTRHTLAMSNCARTICGVKLGESARKDEPNIAHSCWQVFNCERCSKIEKKGEKS